MSDAGTFDLGTNTEVPLSPVETDATGALVTPEVAPVWSVDDSTVLTLQDQADGTTLALRATKGAGKATVTATVTNPDGTVATGTIALTLAAVVTPPADVADVTIVPGVPA